MNALLTTKLQPAIHALQSGGVIAYPTESCFGLGCDPFDTAAVKNILKLKRRSVNKGLILIASSIEQAERYVELDTPLTKQIRASWPGANTWLLPPKLGLPNILRGKFPLLAIRVTAHPIANSLCDLFGGAIVSTSANVANEPALKCAKDVRRAFAKQLDNIVAMPIGQDPSPSTIRNGITGEILRK